MVSGLMMTGMCGFWGLWVSFGGCLLSTGISDAVLCSDHLVLCWALGQDEPAPGSHPSFGCAVLLEGTGNPQEQAGGGWRSLPILVKPSQGSSLT